MEAQTVVHEMAFFEMPAASMQPSHTRPRLRWIAAVDGAALSDCRQPRQQLLEGADVTVSLASQQTASHPQQDALEYAMRRSQHGALGCLVEARRGHRVRAGLRARARLRVRVRARG